MSTPSQDAVRTYTRIIAEDLKQQLFNAWDALEALESTAKNLSTSLTARGSQEDAQTASDIATKTRILLKSDILEEIQGDIDFGLLDGDF
jgi:hypothetical protein